jgi:hypothetical protein
VLLADQVARIAKIVTGVCALAVDPTGTTSAVITGANVTADSYLGLRDILAASQATQATARVIERRIADELAAPNFHMPKDGPVLLPQMVERTVPTPTDLLRVDLAIADPQTKASRLLELILARMPDEYTHRADLIEAFCNLLRPAYATLFANDDFLKTQAPAIARETHNKLSEIADSLLSLSKTYVTLARSLDDLRHLHHSQLEALAFRFGLAPARDMAPVALLAMIQDAADAFRAGRQAPVKSSPQFADLYDRIQAAEDNLQFATVEQLLAEVTTIRQQILDEATARAKAALETQLDAARELANDLERSARNALNMHDPDAAFALLSRAADSFAGLDALEPARRRADYASLLYNHALRFGGTGLALAAQMWRDGLGRVTREQDAGLWAALQNNLAIALETQGTSTAGAAGTDLLAQAVAAYDAALTVYTRDTHPVHWAMTMQNKACALYTQGTRSAGAAGTGLLAQAVAAYDAALTVYTQDAHPVDWATTMQNKAIALETQGTSTAGAAGTDLLAQAVIAYDAALTVYTQDAHPVDWAMTMQNKAAALRNQGSRTAGAAGTDLLAQAVAAYDAALTVYTQDAHPVDWATTMQNKAGALQTQGSRTAGAAGTDLLAQAVAAYDAAQTVYTQDAHPVHWATTMQNKGNALGYQGKRTPDPSGLRLIAQARAACLEALTVRTRADHPAQWAMTQENLAILEHATARHPACPDPAAHLRAALAHVDLSLEVYDPVHMYHDHATATALRAGILSDLGEAG